MMKKTKIKIFGFLATIALLVLSVTWLRSNSTLFNLFFPPSDMYEPLAVSKLSSKDEKYEFTVINKYPGYYEVAVQAPSSNGIGDSFEMDFTADATLRVGDKILLKTQVLKPLYQFWQNEGGGIVIVNYKVPDLVPKNTPIQIDVTLFGNTKKFNEKYGQSELVIIKSSDK